MHETKSTDTRLHNVFNEFLSLANTQFIENRVYEDDTDTAKAKEAAEEKKKEETEKKEKTREEREAEIVPKFKEALTVRRREEMCQKQIPFFFFFFLSIYYASTPILSHFV